MAINTNFQFAPPITIIDGLKTVPIDIQTLDAKVIFDRRERKAKVEVLMTFVMGEEDGYPIFDLRQEIQEAYLNNISLSPEQLPNINFDGSSDNQLRIIKTIDPVSANSLNTLGLIYELNKPNATLSNSFNWDFNPGFYWDFWFSDLWAARYLEMWFPCNLIYDRFVFNLEVQLLNSDEVEHLVITNGTVMQQRTNHWKIKFPDRFTSLSPMLVIAPKERIEERRSEMILPDGSKLHLDTFKLKERLFNLEEIEAQVIESITNNINTIGAYIHERFTTFIWDGANTHLDNGRTRSGMEYEGGTTTSTSALVHELFHSWFARGVKPATQNDSWIDEAWTEYNTSNQIFEPFDLVNNNPIILCSKNPWNRTTPSDSMVSAYREGARVFASVATVIGRENLLSYMSLFYRENVRKLVTTKQLEEYLISKSGRPEIADYFKKFVYEED